MNKLTLWSDNCSKIIHIQMTMKLVCRVVSTVEEKVCGLEERIQALPSLNEFDAFRFRACGFYCHGRCSVAVFSIVP